VTVLHFVSGTVLTINVCNYFGNLLFANYCTAVYSVVTATNFTWYSSLCRNTSPPTGIEYLSLSGLCAFQTLTPLLKFHKYSHAYSDFQVLRLLAAVFEKAIYQGQREKPVEWMIGMMQAWIDSTSHWK